MQMIVYIDNIYTNPGGVQGTGSGSCDRPDTFTGEPGICSELIQMHTRTNPDNSVSGFLGELGPPGAKPPQWEGKKDQGRGPPSDGSQTFPSEETVSASRKVPQRR